MNLAEIIFEKIPPATLERVVFDQGILDPRQRTELFKASGLSYREIALKTVELYRDQAARLALSLYEQIYDTDWETARDLYEHFERRADVQYINHQASLVGRLPTLPIEELNEFLRTVKRQVCFIVSREGNHGLIARGTGFLVGPDLVLTCRHVLKSFNAGCDILTNGNRIEIYFDFFYGGPVEDIGPSLPSGRMVGLRRDWLVESRDWTSPDGLEGQLDSAEAERISKALDFVLIRLDAPVGLQPLDRGGGRRRGWVALAEDTVPQNLRDQDWIIIPQHPNGFPQRIDLGRFKAVDQTGTRIRYRVNAAPGSSGAPCFNHNFALVGVHNAYVGPPEKPLANQAIRFDHIAALVRQYTSADVNRDLHTSRWSISRANERPRVVLGRDKLLAWLRASATGKPRNLADRVYVAQSFVPGAGCSFSLDVLHAEIRDTKTPRSIYTPGGQQLPSTPEDFLLSLIRELGIDAEQVERDAKMPIRPNAPRSLGPGVFEVGEVDKLERWLSDELPNWLGGVITKHVEKEIDARVAARELVKAYMQQRIEPPEDLQTQADAPEPILVRPNSWEFAYVAIDGLRGTDYSGRGERNNFDGEVRSLIAALVKGKSEQSMHPGLRRLRWMFLGYLPDFISAASSDTNGATLEILDPAAIGVDQVLGLFERMSQTHLPMQDVQPFMARVLALTIVDTAETTSGQETRLLHLQREASTLSARLLVEMGK